MSYYCNSGYGPCCSGFTPPPPPDWNSRPCGGSYPPPPMPPYGSGCCYPRPCW